jgi:glycosyltransferase involved in cell wall biosynthesis
MAGDRPMPSASVLLSVYDHGALLPRAIESVLAQTTGDWELVVANDGSTDDSGEVAASYASRHPSVRLLDLEHRGLAAAVNAAARVATGRYLTALDADDWYEPRHLEENLRHLAERPEIDLLMSTARVIGDPWVVDLERPGEMIHLDACAIGGTFFVRREVFEALGGMPPVQFGVDYRFARSVREAGYVVEKRAGRTYVYDRSRGGAMTRAAEATMREGVARGRRPASGATGEPSRRR